ncbi:hypothetical protein C8R44DRAFT_731204 [Mycena epipterygia]|nr:hypothetical protein C8R44DRAFT_731204 [Mycena epipterygia]
MSLAPSKLSLRMNQFSLNPAVENSNLRPRAMMIQPPSQFLNFLHLKDDLSKDNGLVAKVEGSESKSPPKALVDFTGPRVSASDVLPKDSFAHKLNYIDHKNLDDLRKKIFYGGRVGSATILTHAGSVGTQDLAYEYKDCVGQVAFHTSRVASGVVSNCGFSEQRGCIENSDAYK